MATSKFYTDLDEFIAEMEHYKPSLYRRFINFFRFRVHGPKRWCREVKWFVQRGRRGYSDADVWSLDYYLATVISGSTRRLAKYNHSYPPQLTEHDWNATLEKIASDFETYAQQDESEVDMSEEELTAAFELLRQYYRHLWD